MVKKESKVRIAALGDLHTRDVPSKEYVDLFTEIGQKVDILVLCGDLTERGYPQEAQALAEELSPCKIPILAVLGNHDLENDMHEDIKRTLAVLNVWFLEDEPRELNGVGFAGVKGFGGGFDKHMLQPWGENTIKQFVQEAVNEAMKLESALAKLRTESKVVALHYSPIRQTVEGEPPEILAYLGSSRLAQPIDNFGVSVVVHGHAHSGAAHGKTPRGVPVHNVSLPLLRRTNPKHPYLIFEL